MSMMSDIEVDSAPPQNYSGQNLETLPLSQMDYQRSSPNTLFGGFTRDNFAFTGDTGQQFCHPTDSSVPNLWTSDRRTNGSSQTQSLYRNSTNNLVLNGSQNSLSDNNTFQSNECNPYNFSHWNTTDSTNFQNSANFSYNNGSSNSPINNSNRVPDISRLSINNTDSSIVFNRPPSEIDNIERQLSELQNSKYPNYRTKAQRIQSYAFSIAPVRSPQCMSEAGFFAIRDQDFVRCFHCGIGLRNWEEDDDPYVEHCRWSPNCQYMKIKKGQAFIDAVQEAVRKVQLEEALGQSETRDCAQAEGSISYQDLSEDGNSQESYPLSVLRKNPLLSNAAQSVIEMGYLPRVVKKAIDSLIPSHGLEGLTGQLIANAVMDMESMGEKCRIPVIQETPKCVDKSRISEETKRKLEEQNREIKEKILCVICCEAERSITFLPCGHLVCCAQCAPACSTCAVCRKEIKGTVKVSLR